MGTGGDTGTEVGPENGRTDGAMPDTGVPVGEWAMMIVDASAAACASIANCSALKVGAVVVWLVPLRGTCTLMLFMEPASPAPMIGMSSRIEATLLSMPVVLASC